MVVKKRRFIPSPPAPLEHRIALSDAGLASARVSVIAHQPTQGLSLYGFSLGSESTVRTRHSFEASGSSISPLGRVSLTGYLVVPKGHSANRRVHGKVTLSNADGSITVALSGTATVYHGRFTYATGNLKYNIVSGTNDYANASGAGPVLYGLGPVFAPGRFLLDFGNYPPPP
jgi:hypothetical protein